MALEVTVIDSSDWVGWSAAATRVGELFMSDVPSMVSAVRSFLGNNRMSRLNILDHGNSTGLEIGRDWVTLGSLPSFEPALRQLRGLFTHDGIVHLQHCSIGRNHEVLRRLSALWDVPVVAGTGLHNPVYRVNFGQYERCYPSGRCVSNVGRP